MNDELYINGIQIELPRSTVIAMSFQVNDLAELKNRQANFSNQFKIPGTDKNRLACGFADNLNSNTKAPYRLNKAKLVQSGIETVPNGVIILEESGSDIIATIYSGIFDFFNQIEGLSIREIPNIDSLNHVWNAQTADDARANDANYIYPVIQTGPVAATGQDLHIKYQLGCVYVHTLIDKIFEGVGFLKSGSILENSFYKSLVIPLQAANHSAQWVLDRSCFVAGDKGGRVEGINNATFYIDFTYEDFDPTVIANGAPKVFDGAMNNFDNAVGEGEYTADMGMFVNVEIKAVTAIEDFEFGIGAARAYIKLMKNGVEYAVSNSYTSSGPDPYTEDLIINESLYLNTGDSLRVLMVFERTTDIASYEWFVSSASTFKVTPSNEVKVGATLNIADHLPDIQQKDLIKAVLGQMFGCIFNSNNLTNVLDIRQFKEIADNKANAVNWTSKLDLKFKPVLKYRIGDYGQTNKLLYKVDQAEEDLLNGLNKDLGNSTILIDDHTLKKSNDLFVLPFAASPSETVLVNTTCAVMTRFTLDGASYVETMTPEPRILSIKYQTRNIKYINEDGSYVQVTGEPVPVAFFVDDTQPKDLGFDSLKANNLMELAFGVLVNTKVLDAYFNLNVNDIQFLDFFLPIFLEQYNEYFYVNLINEFLENKSTECELIRL